MPTVVPRPDLDVCISAASQITASALNSGQLQGDIEAVKKYFSDMYAHILKTRQSR